MLNLIVAHCRHRGIGFKNTLPWFIKSDLKRFKHLTIGNGNNAVIMGRKTWESLPVKHQPLSNRTNVIISNTLQQSDVNKYITNCRQSKTIKVVKSIQDAKKFCIDNKFDDTWVIGGDTIYTQFLKCPDISYIYITEINNEFNCDAFFSPIPDYFRYISNSNSVWQLENGLWFKNKVLKNIQMTSCWI